MNMTLSYVQLRVGYSTILFWYTKQTENIHTDKVNVCTVLRGKSHEEKEVTSFLVVAAELKAMKDSFWTT